MNALESYKDATIALVRSALPDLSQRQMAVLLIVYTEAAPQTVRGLAARLNVSKPAITRALDRLGELNMARREMDPNDRRSVLVRRTDAGFVMVQAIRKWLGPTAQAAE